MKPAALIPVKSYGAAKQRLSEHLTPAQRYRIARWLSERVIAGAAPLPVFVVCDDAEVAELTADLGAEIIWAAQLGLNGAVDHGVATVRSMGFDHVVIAHGDLPLSPPLATTLEADRVVIYPDQRHDGTNVLSRPTEMTLPARYGRGSFRRHLGEAVRAGAKVTVRHDERFSIDLDTIEDCRHRSVAPLLAQLVPAEILSTQT